MLAFDAGKFDRRSDGMSVEAAPLPDVQSSSKNRFSYQIQKTSLNIGMSLNEASRLVPKLAQLISDHPKFQVHAPTIKIDESGKGLIIGCGVPERVDALIAVFSTLIDLKLGVFPSFPSE